MAHKKGQGSVRNGRDSVSKRLGVKAYGGELSKSEIDYIVTYMRYMWDDRFEIPAEALKPLFPPLADGEVPSHDIHIQPIVNRY